MNELDVIAFADESCKPVRDRATGKVLADSKHYVAAAAVTFVGDLDAFRSQLDDIAVTFGRPLHYRRLSVKQRLEALDVVAALDGWDGHLFETAIPFRHGTSEHHVRAKLVEATLVRLSHHEGAVEVVFETRNNPSKGFEILDKKDHEVLRRLHQQDLVPSGLRIRHDGKDEPAIAIADLLAGARTDHLCAVDDEPFARVTHRVRTIEPIHIG